VPEALLGALMVGKYSFDKITHHKRWGDGSRVIDPRRVWDGVPRKKQT